MADQTPSIDGINARSSTRVVLVIDGLRVGRVQSFRESISNNVQVLAELGRMYNVELKKGVTTYRFSISRFYCRADAMDQIKLGKVFGIALRDEATITEQGTGQAELLEYFPRCMIESLDRDYTIGAATVGESASVVTVGKGIQVPALTV